MEHVNGSAEKEIRVWCDGWRNTFEKPIRPLTLPASGPFISCWPAPKGSERVASISNLEEPSLNNYTP